MASPGFSWKKPPVVWIQIQGHLNPNWTLTEWPLANWEVPVDLHFLICKMRTIQLSCRLVIHISASNQQQHRSCHSDISKRRASVVQQVKLPLSKPASHAGAPVPGYSVPDAASCECAWESRGRCLEPLGCWHPRGRSTWSSRLLASAWPRPGCDSHPGSKSANGRSMSSSLPVALVFK